MTDEEIEKSLYACGIEAKCNNCLYIENCNKASNLVKDALDYINRLKADKEDMYGEIMNLRAYIDNHEEIWKSNMQIENERFVKNMRNVLEIEKEQIRKDTAKEILQLMKRVQAMFYDKEYVAIQNLIAEKYGVEVEMNNENEIEIVRLKAENAKLKEFYKTVKSYYADLDCLAKRLQDDYNGDKPFEQQEQDRLGICYILDLIDTMKDVDDSNYIKQAVKEFAATLKERACAVMNSTFDRRLVVDVKQIDDLITELYGADDR